MGNPFDIDDEPRKDIVVGVRMDARMREELRRLARMHGCSEAAFVRKLVRRAARLP